jgi:cellulose biosynthesis protein BcsQ/F0F1-type ATP synthase membrane subunit b/b'
MNWSEFYRFLQEVLQWDAGRLAALVTGVALTVALIWLLWSWLPFSSKRLRGVVDELLPRLQKDREEALKLQQQLQTDMHARQMESKELQDKVIALSANCEELKEEAAALERNKQEVEAQVEPLRVEMAQAREEIASLESQVGDLSRQVQAVVNSDGRIWEKSLTESVPQPRFPGRPQTPIISVVNLKGGVGKTTITANLGASLWNKGDRVLLVDLDYQASLTALCLPGERIEHLRRGGRLVSSLFRAHHRDPDELWNLAERIDSSADGFIVAADENLQDAEMQVMGRWFLEPDGPDPRFLLRQILHAPQVQDSFELIVLDCPPRLTTACVNALCCSDFVLIPMLLDKTSADSVPRLLKWLRQFQKICLDLELLGILANRATLRNNALIKAQQVVWAELPGQCQDVWGGKVYHFETVIRQDNAFAEVARSRQFAATHPKLQSTFVDLAAEMQRRISIHECRRTAAVS